MMGVVFFLFRAFLNFIHQTNTWKIGKQNTAVDKTYI